MVGGATVVVGMLLEDLVVHDLLLAAELLAAELRDELLVHHLDVVGAEERPVEDVGKFIGGKNPSAV